MRLIGKVFDWIVLIMNIVLLVVFVAAAYSDRISPLKHIYPSYLGIVFPFIFASVILFALYWAIRMKWYVLLSFVAVAACWEPVTRYMPYHLIKNEPVNHTIKLLTYNTCAMGRYDIAQRDKPNDVIRFINEQNADIVCLQEYVFRNKDNCFSESYIKKQLPEYPYYYFHQVNHNAQFGLAIFSKFPIKSTEPIRYKSLYTNSCMYVLDIDGQKITLINNHLESNKLTLEDRQFYDSMVKNFDTEKVGTIRNTLIHKLSDAYRIRAEQAEKLHNIISGVKTPLIVCGDFNDTPISYCYQTIRGDLTDAYKNSGSGIGITFHEYNFLFRIDHIFHSGSIKSYDAKIHHVNYSDHYPVTVTLEMPAK